MRIRTARDAGDFSGVRFSAPTRNRRLSLGITTCFSPHGRNRTCGERLGKGETLDAILEGSTSVVEGVPTTRSVVELARRENVDMPITGAVHKILFEGLSPADAIRSLMSRELKTEQIG